MPIALIRGLNIAYEIIGNTGPWVALTPGGRRSHYEFLPLARKIAAAGYRVLLHDRRNTGASDILIDGDEGEESLWIDDLHELLKQQDALPAFIGGSSAGARMSIRYYLRHGQGVRGLMLFRVTGGAFAARQRLKTIMAIHPRREKLAWRACARPNNTRSVSRPTEKSCAADGHGP